MKYQQLLMVEVLVFCYSATSSKKIKMRTIQKAILNSQMLQNIQHARQAKRELAALAVCLWMMLGGYGWVAVSYLQAASPPGQYYAATNGSPAGDGSITKPWDLVTALNAPALKPGDTLLLRGGTYTNPSNFIINKDATAAQPITMKSYPGEWAVIDGKSSPNTGVVVVNGDWWVLRDFEVTNTALPRTEGRGQGFVTYGAGTKIINTVVHDTNTCVGFWSTVTNGEMNGNILYNCGVTRFDHGIYTQNPDGSTKIFTENIVSNSFGYNVHGYSSSGALKGFEFYRNVFVENDGINPAPDGNNVMIGGSQPAERVKFIGNLVYGSPRHNSVGLRVGYSGSVQNRDFLIEDNYIAQSQPLTFLNATEITGQRNTTVTHATNTSHILLVNSSLNSWNNNSYYKGKFYAGNGLTFEQWKAQTGMDGNSSWQAGSAPDKVFIEPNDHVPGRAIVTVFNWSKKATASINPGSVVKIGQKFEIRDAQNYLGTPIVSGTYNGGGIQLPLTSRAAAQPVGGMAPNLLTPEFGVFVMNAIDGSTSLPPVSTTTAASQPSSSIPTSSTTAEVSLLTAEDKAAEEAAASTESVSQTEGEAAIEQSVGGLTPSLQARLLTILAVAFIIVGGLGSFIVAIRLRNHVRSVRTVATQIAEKIIHPTLHHPV